MATDTGPEARRRDDSWVLSALVGGGRVVFLINLRGEHHVHHHQHA